MPGEAVQRSEFDAWYEAATKKYGLRPDRYVRQGALVVDTDDPEPQAEGAPVATDTPFEAAIRSGSTRPKRRSYGGALGEALLERQAALAARARERAQAPEVAWSPTHREIELEALMSDLANPDDEKTGAPALQRDTLRLKAPYERQAQRLAPVPEPLRRGHHGRLSEAYMAQMRSVKSPSGRLLLRPSRFAEMLAQNPKATRRDKRILAQWAKAYEDYEREQLPGLYNMAREDEELLEMESARDSMDPLSEEHKTLSAGLAERRAAARKRATWNSLPGIAKVGVAATNVFDSALGGYIPGLNDAFAWMIDKAPLGPGTMLANRLTGGKFGEAREALTGSDVLPEDATSAAKTVGMMTGMAASPINRVVPGANAGSTAGRVAHGAAGFGALTAADRAKDLTLGRYVGGDWKNAQERLDAAADEYAKSTGAKDESALNRARQKYLSQQADPVLAAAKDTAGAAITGGFSGLIRPLREGLMAATARLMPNSSPQKVALLRSLAGNQFDNAALNAIPQWGAEGWHAPILTTAMFGEGDERARAIEALLAGVLTANMGLRTTPDAGVTGRDVHRRLVGEGRVAPDDFQAVWGSLDPQTKQLLTAAALRHAKTQGDFIGAIAEPLEAQMKQVRATTDAIRQAQADVATEAPPEAAPPATPAASTAKRPTTIAEEAARLLGKPTTPADEQAKADVRAVSDDGDVVEGRDLGAAADDPDAPVKQYIEVTDGDGRKRVVTAPQSTVETILGAEQKAPSKAATAARLGRSQKAAEAAAAKVDLGPEPILGAQQREPGEAETAARLEASRKRAEAAAAKVDADPHDSVPTRHLGRDVSRHQARVESEWLEAASKTEALENDPQAQAVGVLLMEAKMGALGRLRGETPEEQYRRLDIAFKTDQQYRDHILKGAGGLEALLDPQRGARLAGPKPELPRGMISFLDDGRSLISILERADVATLGHEMSHFLEHYIPEGHEAILTIKRFLGIKPDEELTSADKEAFARLFELYDHSGQAPTKALTAVFDSAAEWMGHVYKKVGKIPLREGAKVPEGHKFFDKVYEAAAKSSHPDDIADAIVRERRIDPDAIVSTKDQGDDAYAHDVKERLAPGVPKSHEEVMEAAARVRGERDAVPADEPVGDTPEAARKAAEDIIDDPDANADAAAAVDRDAPDLFDASAAGDEAATDALAERAARDIANPPRNPKGRPVTVPAADFDALTSSKRSGYELRGDVLITPEGAMDVKRDGDTVTLTPTEKPVKPKEGTTLFAGVPMPGGLGKTLSRLDEAIGGAVAKVTGVFSDPLLDVVANKIAFNPDLPITSWLRKNFTELGWDPGITQIQQRASGKQQQVLKEVIEPVLAAAESAGVGGKKDNAAQNEAFARALDSGADLPDHEVLTKTLRKGFDDVWERLTDVGAVDPNLGQRFKGRYFARHNFTEPTEKATRKEIKRLTALQRKKGLTAGQERQLAGARQRLKELTSPQPTPAGLVKRFGEIRRPLDAKDVLAATNRMRERTIDDLDEAIAGGLDISSHPLRDQIVALMAETKAATSLETFAEIREYGAAREVPGGNGRHLVEPPSEKAPAPGYTRIPETAAGFGGIPSFGKLAGHWVHDSVWSQLEVHLHKPSDIGRAYDALHSFLKKGKTAYRLGGHLLQWAGNPLIWTMHGVPAAKFGSIYSTGHNLVHGHDTGKTFEVNGKQVPYTRTFAFEEGILTSDHAGDPALTRKAYPAEFGSPPSVMEAVLGVAERMVPGARMLQDAYGLPDQYSRAGLYAHFRESGMGHDQAVQKVRSMYDMTNVPRGVAALARHWSFFRFSYSMLRNTKEMARHTPWALAKAAGFFYMMQQAHRAMLGVSQEEYDEALYGALPGDDLGQVLKRATAMPWINEDGRPGFWTLWNMFPQQTILQGLMPTPAEERGGGTLERIGLALAGGQSLVWKPVLEAMPFINRDFWSGQRNLLRNRYGVTGEGGRGEWAMGALKHVGKNWTPSILGDSAAAMDAAGAFPRGVSIKRPDSSGRFKSTADATANALGINVRRPDEQRAKIIRANEALERDPRIFHDAEGHAQVRTEVVDPLEVKGARTAIQERDTELVRAAALRATAWLNEGNVDEAVKEIRTRTRLKEMRKALTPEQRVALDAASARAGILPRLKR